MLLSLDVTYFKYGKENIWVQNITTTGKEYCAFIFKLNFPIGFQSKTSQLVMNFVNRWLDIFIR